MKSSSLAQAQSLTPSLSLITLYGLSFLFGVTVGIFNPLMSTLMERHQVSHLWIGATSTVYFLAIALATPNIEKLLHQFGIRTTLVLGCLLILVSAPLFPLTSVLGLWFILRIVMGVGVCAYLLSGQTALNLFCHEENRAGVNGIYFLAMGLGFIIGPTIGPYFYQISPLLAFLAGAGGIIAAISLSLLCLPPRLSVESVSRPRFFHLLKRFQFPIHGIFAYGMAEATLITLYPVFLLKQNYTVPQMGFALSVFVVGSLFSTIPVTRLADRYGKVKALSCCIIGGLWASIGLITLTHYHLLLLCSGLVGASIGPVYPLCLALVGEQVPKRDVAAGTALFTTTYSLGNATGPILAAIMMETLGNSHIFSGFIPLYLILLLRIVRRKPYQLKAK
jgi:MFS family permease